MPEEDIKNLFEDKIIMITGGLGSIGSGIVNQLLTYNPKQIRILENRETELFYANIESKSDNVVFLFGDVRDKQRLLRTTAGVDMIFHAAAMKHVYVSEYNPFEAVKTNVIGTQNVIESSLEHSIDRMVLISTDKVVNPTNVMGATKLLAERLVSAVGHHGQDVKTKFGVVRFGNVLASRGSVLEIWDKQLKKKEKISITSPDMTRFFMSIPDSVKLIFTASYYAENGETFILKMPSVKIGDLATAFLEVNGSSLDNAEVTGIRPGEKMHEELIFEGEAGLLMENDELFVRLPLTLDLSSETESLKEKGFWGSEVSDFSSNDKRYLLNIEEIKKVLSI